MQVSQGIQFLAQNDILHTSLDGGSILMSDTADIKIAGFSACRKPMGGGISMIISLAYLSMIMCEPGIMYWPGMEKV